MKIRKQVHDLTLDDLQRFPIWEFCLDEEGEEEQDECTVRPFQIGECDLESMFVCSATFTLADGREFRGFVSPAKDLSESQPSLYVDDQKIVYFWHGIVRPSDDEIEETYELLGGRGSNIFPITWRTQHISDKIPQEGKIEGIYYLKNRVPERIT